MFYNNIHTYTFLNPGRTPRLKVSLGIRQGCLILSKLFILCAQLLVYLIVSHPEFKGINILIMNFVTVNSWIILFFKGKINNWKSINTFYFFSMAFFLYLSLNKCKLLPQYPCTDFHIMTIPFKPKVNF